MSFTSESEETMTARGYELLIVDDVRVFCKQDGLVYDEEAYIDYEIKPWMSRCITRGIHVDKEYAKSIAIERGDQAE